MRVLHLLDHSVPLHSGYAFRTLAILREQRARGWDTVQLTSSKHYGAVADVEEAEGLQFYRTRVPGSRLRSWPIVGQAAVVHDTQKRLDEIVALTRPDILHAHSPCLNGIAALRVGRRRRLPVVYELRASWEDAAVDHGTTTEGSLRYRFSRTLETWVLRRADAVTTICGGLRDDILARGGVTPGRVEVIPNAVDPASFAYDVPRDEQLKRQLGLGEATVIGFIGSFYGYEGLDLLIEALPIVTATRPDVRLLLVGGGPQEAALREQVLRAGLADKVAFAGRVPHGDVQRYYGLVDVFAYPRRSIRLTELVTPLKPLEAMAQGHAFVASDVGGHRELIRDGETGVLFRAGNAASLADALLGLLAEPARRQRLRAAGRHYIETERTWSASVARYAPVYERVLGR